jgi:lipoprotein-releasing system permease protein
MNTEFFISKRLFFDKTNQQFLSKKIIRIALFGIALSLAVMIVSLAVITGFKTEIRNKVIGFGSHIQIINFESRNSYENPPISKNQPFTSELKNIKGVESVQVFATKPGIMKTDETTQGIVFKGVDTGYNWSFFEKNLVDGVIPKFNDTSRVNEILLSENISRILKLKTGESAVLYFVNETELTPRMLQLKVSGIYSTSLEEFDNLFVIGDIKQIQRLNDWQPDEITGFEILVSDFNKIGITEMEVRNLVINYSNENTAILRTESITRQYPQIFDWLSVLDMNVWVILSLIVMVAGFNMISALLVLILERSTMIGVLKALGSPNRSIRKVFLYLSVFLTSRGMLWGNIIGIAIILIQKYFHLIKLNQATYYVDVVPVNFNIMHILLLNIGCLLVTTFMLVIPSYLVSKISPDKSIRFD